MQVINYKYIFLPLENSKFDLSIASLTVLVVRVVFFHFKSLRNSFGNFVTLKIHFEKENIKIRNYEEQNSK